MEDKVFYRIDLKKLEQGMLVDRPMFAYLEKNQRYLQVAKPLYPLDERALQLMHKFGRVYSNEAPVEERYAKLWNSTRKVQELCDNAWLAPFEKSAAIRQETEWLVPIVFEDAHSNADHTEAAIFFIHRTFGVPTSEALMFVSDLSVEMYGRALKAAAVAGVLALWAGYPEPAFVCQLIESVFCEEVGLYRDSSGQLFRPGGADLLRAQTAQLISEGAIPGIRRHDRRFWQRLLRIHGRDEDEVQGIAQLARALVDRHSTTAFGPGPEQAQWAWNTRIARKLLAQFKIDPDVRKAAA